MFEQRRTVRIEMFAQANGPAFRQVGQKFRQPPFALLEGFTSQVASIEEKEIEGIINQGADPAFFQGSLESGEAWSAVCVFHHQFAVKHRRARVDLLERLGKGAEFVSPIEPAACKQLDFISPFPYLYAIAVE